MMADRREALESTSIFYLRRVDEYSSAKGAATEWRILQD